MTSAVLAFLAGVVWVQQLAQLPSLTQFLALSAVACWLTYRRFWPGVALLFGILWACAFAAWCLNDRLADNLQGQDVSVEGYVASMPRQQDDRISFDFMLTQDTQTVPRKIRLSWYHPRPAIRAGQGWRMTVRLKRPHGRLNPGGFDYEAWLFANDIGASGYVRDKITPQPIDPGFCLQRSLVLWRQAIADRLDALLPGSEQAGVIKALTIGEQGGISQQQWAVFRATGIVHLVVISGSHISLIAGLAFLLSRKAWARFGNLRFSPQNVAALAAWLSALLYAGLAGFSIPTQRAVIMLTVALAAIAAQRNVTTFHILLLALVAVVGFDPLAVLSVGFWLSFAAVALLLYVSCGRLGQIGFWKEALQAQWVTALGLSPLLIVFFQQVSLISPLVNWLAVPLIGLLIVPLCLTGLLLSWLIWPLARRIFGLMDQLLQWLYGLLERLSDWPLATLSLPEPAWYALVLAVIGSMVLLAPKGLPARYLGILLWLPLLFPILDKPLPGEVRFSLLDVGQGLSAVVQTSEHVLIFDTGARFSEQSDMGESVLLPFLHYRGISSIDTLFVSHGDIDHSGGAEALLAQMPATAIYSSVAEYAERRSGSYCRAGQSWQWDCVVFEVLSPFDEPFAGENDNSCVLKVTTAKRSILLTGDIEQAAENRLVEKYGETLASSILIAPHHGSKTSSSRPFLQQVAPKWVLIPAGHLNRFGFPHRQVLQRYRELNIESLITGEQGAITVTASGESLQIERERQNRKRYWMAASTER